MALEMLTGPVRVLVQPDDGVEPVVALIRSARQRLLIKQFTMQHPALIEAVIAQHRAGVDVRVMLNPHRSSGSRANDETEAVLVEAGVRFRWSTPRVSVTHEKSVVIDDGTALIATFNFGEKYFTMTRDYGLVVEDRGAIEQMVACFDADWEDRPFAPAHPTPLLWSPVNSRETMSAFVDGAEKSLWVQHPKFSDITVLDRLVEAARRGVKVHIICGGKHGISDWDVLDTFSSLRVLRLAGAKVRKQRKLRLHAKLIVADRKHVLVGSQNIDRSAFDLRRELGAMVADPGAVDALCRQFKADWKASHDYEPPDPLAALMPPETDFPHMPDLVHE